MDIDGMFAGMAKAEIFGRGTFMGPGLYVVETKNIFVKEGFKGKSFIAEFTVLESNNPKHEVGSSGSYVLKFENKFTFGNITEFVMALLGVPNTKENQTNESIRKQVELVARAACGSEVAKKELGKEYEDGMLHGIQLKLECTQKPTQPTATKPAGVYTAHTWTPLDTQPLTAA